MNILITGGASGLGKSITSKIAANSNFKIYFTYVSSILAAKDIEEEYPNTKAIKCDFKNPKEIDDLSKKISELDIDVLINNAYTGDFLSSYFHKTSADDFAASFSENILPTISITQAAIGVFRKKKFGKIITILTSALTNTPPIGSSVYIANKAYLQQLTKVWANENIKFNITSNSVSPAFMLTKLTNSTDERIVEQITNSHPLKQLLTTDEVADSVIFLVNSTQQLNGIDLLINAGLNIK